MRGRAIGLPTVQGSTQDKDKYLIALIRTQKSLHDYRPILKDTLEQIKKANNIDAMLIQTKYPPDSVSRETPAWVTYKGDTIVNDFIDSLSVRTITFVGSETEMGEFVLRFILSQLGHDWESAILMVWEMLGEGNTLVMRELNEELKKFDYCGVFQ